MTLGILGGGQLGRMTALAALPLGARVRFLVPEASDCVDDFADVTVADWTDADVLRRWAGGCDAVAIDSEWAPIDRLADAAPDVRVSIGAESVRAVRDKAAQRRLFARLGIAQPAFVHVTTKGGMADAAARVGLPCVAKRVEGSYDGYGNRIVRTAQELGAAWDALGDDARGLLVEAFVSFDHEAAAITVRATDGAAVHYPALRTEQRDHRCHAVTATDAGMPGAATSGGSVSDTTAAALRETVTACADELGIVGLLALEVFVLPDGRILANELAPRPHNSGHVTMDACACGQFENHARALLGLPLGPTAMRAPAAVMVNVLGTTDGPVSPSDLRHAVADALVAHPAAHVHLYGKRASRAGRKMGHVTALAATPQSAREAAEAAAARLVL